MRIGVLWEPSPNAFYRAVDPLNEMERRGHELVLPPQQQGDVLDLDRLATCDVIHVYRLANNKARAGLSKLVKAGVPIVYDNDDDLAVLPKGSPNYRTHGALRGQQIFSMTLKAAQMARVFTTTNEVLAEKYRRFGVSRAEVIPNCVIQFERQRIAHKGTVIGWLAGVEHAIDAQSLRMREVLERVLETHPDVYVEVIGVDLGLKHERFFHERMMKFHELPTHMGVWDIGIAPLVDAPINRARSDIKLKEYAASGVAWLASPVGPYRGLGEEQGGRLVADDAWFEALDRMITENRETFDGLRRQGVAWAQSQTIQSVADRWEAVFEEAAAASR